MEEQHYPTTPSGRRSLTFAHVASPAGEKTRPPGRGGHKWTLIGAIRTASVRIKVSKRSSAAPETILNFHPETALTGEGFCVSPSNCQPALRQHCTVPATRRPTLAVLVKSGRIVRRDGPNGNFYTQKTDGAKNVDNASFCSQDFAPHNIFRARIKFIFPVCADVSSFSVFGQPEQRMRSIRPRSRTLYWPDIPSSRGFACG